MEKSQEGPRFGLSGGSHTLTQPSSIFPWTWKSGFHHGFVSNRSPEHLGHHNKQTRHRILNCFQSVTCWVNRTGCMICCPMWELFWGDLLFWSHLNAWNHHSYSVTKSMLMVIKIISWLQTTSRLVLTGQSNRWITTNVLQGCHGTTHGKLTSLIN